MIKFFLKNTRLYKPLTKVYDIINYNRIFIITCLKLLSIKKNNKVYFFFPFYHTGGAEKVHLDIINSIEIPKVIIFTNDSSNNALLKQFNQKCKCLEINIFIKDKTSLHYKLTLNLIKNKINNTSKSSTFGCHSLFYYELIPLLNKNIKTIDLIHAFTGLNEPGFEKISLPFISHLKKRITINSKTKNDLISLYKQKEIPDSEIEKIEIIQNKINNINQKLYDKPNDSFTLIYLGRNSPEKRIYLIGRIAKVVKNKYPNIEILLVGENLEIGIENECKEYCNFTGRIDDTEILNKLYVKSHLVIITSEREGFPMVFMEGMINGTVPITTNVGGIPEHIINNQNGIIINNDLSESELINEFCEKILLMYENRKRLSILSLSAFEYAKNCFSENEFNERYNTLLNK